MAKRKWNNGDWYNYNLRKYQSRESNSLVKERDEKIEQIEKIKNRYENIRQRAWDEAPFGTEFLELLGINNSYNSTRIKPLERKISEVESYKLEVWQKYQTRIYKKEDIGKQKYDDRRKELRVLEDERKKERKIRKVEYSKNVRGSQASMKRILIDKALTEYGYIKCHYCEKKLDENNSSEVELEHKTPVSRGGTNKRSNVVLACFDCNREKGRKTEKEFLKSKSL